MPINFRRLFFFGDSITDAGRLPEPFRPDPPYDDGRFTNGLVYAQLLTQELQDFGVTANNYAYGGAKALPSEPQQLLIGLDAQVSEFEISYLLDGPGASAAVIFIGGNDYHDVDPSDPTIVSRVLESIDDAAMRLARRGVDELILFNLPLSSQIPRRSLLSAAELAAEDAMIKAHNDGLQQLAATYSGAGVRTTIVDVYRLLREVRADKETFGLKAVNSSLYILDEDDMPVRNEITSQFDPDEVAFFDPVHPSAAGHGILAAFAEATLRADLVTFRGSGNDTIGGSSGADLVVAAGGSDQVLAGTGDDVVLAGLGDDTVSGSDGSDLIIGGRGNDRITGSTGSDLLAGSAGNDNLSGGGDHDVLILGTGLDSASGGAGNDLLIITDDALTGLDTVSGGTETDTLRLEVSEEVFVSDLFQEEIHDFVPGAETMLSIGLTAIGVERLEVYVDGTQKFATDNLAPNQGTTAAARLRDADLWGLV
ncbi:SGNH/GDSL hydrolase family protein [Microvirga sp. KLBC 81]|uniref:SGNH/GDSL hydrolase family protein n=1 Tax=Microvirga sp. KLBC 81 TaxID=1862707 RepID=UPI001402293D|nr:SGNH/GDSL hydrolase family protein [Microvirga sp. KLBC 81]